MSTKIYYGCRLVEGADIFDFTNKLRTVLLPIYDAIVTRSSILCAALAVKEAREGGVELPSDPLLTGFWKFQDCECKTFFRQTEFSVSFQRDLVSGRIHALPFMDANHYVNAWYSLSEVEKYGYWNNTDQPDEVSDDEWNERQVSWDRVFGNDAVSERSLLFTLVELGSGTKSLSFPRNGLLWSERLLRRELIERYMCDEIYNIEVSVDDLLG